MRKSTTEFLTAIKTYRCKTFTVLEHVLESYLGYKKNKDTRNIGEIECCSTNTITWDLLYNYITITYGKTSADFHKICHTLSHLKKKITP